MNSLFIQAGAVEVSVANAQLPWSGSPPLAISYRDDGVFDVLYALFQVGRCTSHTTNGEESGSFWANLRGSPDRRAPSTEPSHQCPADHILAWPGLERRFVLEFYAVNNEPPGDRMAKWLLRMTFNLSEITGVLMLTGVWRGYRPLLKVFQYRDTIEEEEEEERARHVQVSTIDTTEHPRSPSLLIDGDLGGKVAPLSNPPDVGLATQLRQRVQASFNNFDIYANRSFTLQPLSRDSWASCTSYLSTCHFKALDDLDMELSLY